ncbi:MAG: Segregation and condensation protein A [Parcubacteria group bacterium GW2011_GWA2_44_12]|nr:MAG: Segregation and condensation protein A [Parcubacteria group bacterium GW2011_GWA2_44_12]
MYHFKLEQFEGPLDVLLQLIEAEKLDITAISLANVADEYVAYVESRPDISLDELADFLVVAARLLILKARTLLPYLVIEEEEDAGGLALQLKMYREYARAAHEVAFVLANERRSFAKIPVKIAAPARFSPGSEVSAALLREIAESLAARFNSAILPLRTIKRIFNIREKIVQITNLMKGYEQVSFPNLLLEVRDRSEIIVTFLAILELMKLNEIELMQETIFGELVAVRV